MVLFYHTTFFSILKIALYCKLTIVVKIFLRSFASAALVKRKFVLHFTVVIIQFIISHPTTAFPVSFLANLPVFMVNLRITIRTAIYKSNFAFQVPVAVVLKPDSGFFIAGVIAGLNFL